MLEMIRKFAIEKPKVLGGLILFIALIFTISMGWWGFANSRSAQGDIVARINGTPIKSTEFARDFSIMKNNYQQMLNGPMGSKILKQLNFPGLVLRNMIYRQLWADEGKKLGLVVSDETIVREISQIPFFMDGTPPRFSKQIYTRFLTGTHQTAKQFEESIRKDLLVQRAQVIVRATAGSPFPQTGSPAAPQASMIDQQKNMLKLEEETVQSFQTQLENSASIKIDQDVLKKVSQALL